VLNKPILVGASRKRFIGERTGREADDRLAGSLAAQVCAYLNGAQIIRTHDVRETRDALAVAEAISASALEHKQE
jgi:dihydropteroate synthase